MAAICGSNECVLVTNGKTAAVIHFRFPGEIQVLNLPVAPHVAKTKAQAVDQKQQKILKQHDKKDEGDKQESQKQNISEHVQKKDYEDRTGTDNRVLASAVSPDGQLIALCDDSKYLHVYQVVDGRCRVLFSSLVAHRCTAVTFTGDSQHVLVADKSGDAYDFDVWEQVRDQNHDEGSVRERITEGVLTPTPGGGQDEDTVGGGSLLLGHHSMLIDLLMADRDRLVVTCDRDEKIRISNYPDAYNIQAFCLGHKKFVVSLAYDETNCVLISGSGDATIRLWTLHGQELHRRNVLMDIPNDDVSPPTNNGGAQTDTQDTIDVPQPQEADNGGQKSQVTIRQMCLCSDCQILFVSIYKSPHILVYKLSDTGPSGCLAIELASVLSGEGIVTSVCVKQKVLWVLRQGESRLNVLAHRLQCEEGTVQLVPVTGDASVEWQVLQTISKQTELLTVATNTQDLIPSLWKSTFQEDFKFNNVSIKRLTGEVHGGKQGKIHRRL